MHPPRRVYAVALLAIAFLSSPQAQQADVAAAFRAQIDRIYTAHAYDAPRFGPARWLPDGTAYAIVERNATGAEIARYDASSGARSVMARTKLDVDDYEWSNDGKQLLVACGESNAADVMKLLSQPRNCGTRIRCAVDEMGRNSVSPCTMPRIAA